MSVVIFIFCVIAISLLIGGIVYINASLTKDIKLLKIIILITYF